MDKTTRDNLHKLFAAADVIDDILALFKNDAAVGEVDWIDQDTLYSLIEEFKGCKDNLIFYLPDPEAAD